MPRLLAGDVGGTKTLLGIFELTADRPRALSVHAYETTAYDSFAALLDRFAQDQPGGLNVGAAALGVAGPVVGDRVDLTNGSWGIDRGELARLVGTTRVVVLNDLAALGHSVGVLETSELEVLQEGSPAADGNAAILAAGTGLGETTLHRVDGRFVPVPSEAGHTDFAARTPRELELVGALSRTHGRVSVEHVVSGPGLVTLHQFAHGGRRCLAHGGAGDPVTPASVSKAGLAGACPSCVEALSMFVAAYGAEAGNLALRAMATSGVFVGGGIAPQILPALHTPVFLDAFRAKGPMEGLLRRVPVYVIQAADAALLGAAVYAQQLARSGH